MHGANLLEEDISKPVGRRPDRTFSLVWLTAATSGDTLYSSTSMREPGSGMKARPVLYADVICGAEAWTWCQLSLPCVAPAWGQARTGSSVMTSDMQGSSHHCSDHSKVQVEGTVHRAESMTWRTVAETRP